MQTIIIIAFILVFISVLIANFIFYCTYPKYDKHICLTLDLLDEQEADISHIDFDFSIGGDCYTEVHKLT